MSVLYIGAYSYSLSDGAPEKSCNAAVETTRVYLLLITIKRSSFLNSVALSGEY
jgi:hypothetical protein